MEIRREPGRTSGGQRGFELDVQLNFAQALPRALALETLRPWELSNELYGPDDQIRSARLTGALAPELALALLRAGLEAGVYRSAELGRRGFLRSGGGATEWMPWRRNVVVPRSQLERTELEDGLRYLVE